MQSSEAGRTSSDDVCRALSLYGYAVYCERNERMSEAMQALQEAAHLDPKSPYPVKALSILYLAMDRPADAIATCKKSLEIDPSDYEAWYLLSRHLRNQGHAKEAFAALKYAFSGSHLRDYPDAFLQIGFELATAYDDQEEHDAALAILKEVLNGLEGEATLHVPDVLEAIARISAKARHFNQALEALTKARDAVREQDLLRARRLSYEVALVLDAQGRPAEALEELDDYLMTQPPTLEPYETRIRLLRELGREAEVLSSLEESCRQDTHNLALRLLLARQYAEEGKNEKAETLYLSLANEAPAPEVYRELFTLFRSQGHTARGLVLLDKSFEEASGAHASHIAAVRVQAILAVLEIDKSLARDLVATAMISMREKKALMPATMRILAATAFQNRQLDAAETLLRACFVTIKNSEGSLYVALLRVLWAEKKHQAVIDLCRDGLKGAQSTNRLLFHDNIARAMVLLGKDREAIAEAEQAVHLAPSENEIHYRLLLAEILRLANHPNQAESECQALLNKTQTPEVICEIRCTLSNIYAAQRDMAKAESQLRLALQADPNNSTANNDLGYLLADQCKSLDEAEALIRKAIAVDGTQKQRIDSEGEEALPNAAYVDSLGWLLFRRGRLQEARLELEKASSLPDGIGDPVVWGHLGDVYFGLGKASQAQAAWLKAVTLFEADHRRERDDQYQDLQKKLNRLESQEHQLSHQ
jgi:tetratricopeptide (TPR) repeat protein